MELTRPSFVVTDREVGLPGWSAPEVVDRLAKLPVPATVYTLAKLAQWRAAEPIRPLRAELEGYPSNFLTQSTFERVRDALGRGQHRVVHRYASILAAMRILIARGRPSPALDPTVSEVEELGDLLLTISRLIGGAAERPLLATPEVVRKMWLGEQAVSAREHAGSTPVFGWLIGASVFRRVSDSEHFMRIDRALRRARRPSLADQFAGLAVWLGHSATGELKPHLYRLPELDRVNRGAAWLARRLACRRKDGPGLVRGWASSPASSRFRDAPFFVFRGTAVCADPLALGELAGLRFGRLVAAAVDGLELDRRERRAVRRWTSTWNKAGLEGFVRGELAKVADTGDRPREDSGQQCDIVVRFGRAVLFVEAKLTYPSPSTLRLRDRERVYDDLMERFAAPSADGLSQVLSTMKTAATDQGFLPNSVPAFGDQWWAVVVTAEPVPCTREWREAWRRAAERLPRPGIQPFMGPVFLTLNDLCWLIELVRDRHDVHEVLGGFSASGAITFTNFVHGLVKRGLPAWLDAGAEDHFAWLGEQVGG